MKNDLVQLVIAAFVLALGGALEELFPKVLDVGVPVLLMAALFAASRRAPLAALLFAVAAGSVEDSLSSLPTFASVSYFVLAAVAAYCSRLPAVCMAAAYPLYQLWLWLWVTDLSSGVFCRVLLSLPMGVVTAAVTALVLSWIERKGALDEA